MSRTRSGCNSLVCPVMFKCELIKYFLPNRAIMDTVEESINAFQG
jgi:hypothetical protein